MNGDGWRRRLRQGVVIPAHPLALTRARKLDERRQRALTRYYLDAGAGGVAVGAHTTQFAIRDPRHGLYRPVLELAAETVSAWEASRRGRGGRPTMVVRVAGVIGPTRQALAEARLARDLGYQVGLLGLGSMAGASDTELIEHARRVGEVIPLMGFYLQPAVGGRKLSYGFWRRFVEIESVVAIKIAPFNRYDTVSVVRAVLDAGQERRIALYTGNDDCIVGDLLGVFSGIPAGGRRAPRARIVGGLLGHWAFWTRRAVELLDRIHRMRRNERGTRSSRSLAGLLELGAEITDANAAIFDVANGFRGCIPGIHEVLRRQGLLRGRWCLDENEGLSPGQAREISRVCAAHPHLRDDEFVRERLDGWLR